MSRYHVQRSIQIETTPERVFETIADFRTWRMWSPWLCAEPEARVDVTDDASSVGSLYSWQGEIVGQGEIEHRELQPGRLIVDEIRFRKPFRSKSEVTFEMDSHTSGTRLTWQMRGNLPWFLFWMRSQMEVFIGMDYERGLKMIKEWLETGKIHTETTIRGVESVGPLRMVGVRKRCAIYDVGSSMETAFTELEAKLHHSGLSPDGQRMSVYHKFDMRAGTFDYTSGVVVPESAGAVPDDFSSWSIPAMRALRVDHVGSYDHLGNGWSAAHQYARYKKLKQSRVGTFEVYRNSPDTTAADALLTEIYMPLK
ncbi:MAG: GyrI-like domain-containing protein [Planctomycetaceae bacterium]